MNKVTGIPGSTSEARPARWGVTATEQEVSEGRVRVPGMSWAVEAERLVKRYRGRAGTVDAVRGVDLRVGAGEVFGFLGPNGAGKSTTIRMLTTLMSLTSGTARVAGVDVMADPDAARRRIGVALQEAGLDPRQSGRELLVLQARLFGLSGVQAADRAGELLELVDLVEAADRRVKGYSGGMKRRLDLASALVHDPDVLFLDEPTTGLDPASRLTVWEELRRINARGTTVFLTTQYLEEADQLCSRLAIIDGGLIVREGTPDQLKTELRHRRGLPTDPTLDEVFLDATGRTRQRLAGQVQEVSA
jgi:ABC-2 type transport system ATP-binding protein